MSIYYQDDYVTLYHGDSLELMSSFANESFDCVITDPPYTERTHSKARANTASGVREGISFNAFTTESLNSALSECGRLTKGWVVATLDYNHAFAYETAPPAGLRQMRIGVWVKNNPMPQITGDRPAQGWEAISYLHKPEKAVWNGGGAAWKLCEQFGGSYRPPNAQAATNPKVVSAAFNKVLLATSNSLEALELRYEADVDALDATLAEATKAADAVLDQELQAATALYAPQIAAANKKAEEAKIVFLANNKLTIKQSLFNSMDKDRVWQ